MILVIDIGNSNIVFGIFKVTELLTEFRIETSREKNAAAYEADFRAHLLEEGINISEINAQLLSSVVPDLTRAIEDVCLHLFGKRPLKAGKESFHKLPLQIINPNQIGTDLVANALFAHEKYNEDAIVVDFGTALTFTAVDAQGKIIGVNIAPGLRTAMKALSGNTAQLPEIPLVLPENVIGNDTVSAIQAGIMIGYTGLVKHMISTMKTVLSPSCKTLATGGLHGILNNLHGEFDGVDKHLTLKGLLAMVKYIQ